MAQDKKLHLLAGIGIAIIFGWHNPLIGLGAGFAAGIAKEVYIAVISMALKEYQDNVHDVESGIITIKPKNTDWNDEYIQMTQFHE